jgi:hypothetical protein
MLASHCVLSIVRQNGFFLSFSRRLARWCSNQLERYVTDADDIFLLFQTSNMGQTYFVVAVISASGIVLNIFKVTKIFIVVLDIVILQILLRILLKLDMFSFHFSVKKVQLFLPSKQVLNKTAGKIFPLGSQIKTLGLKNICVNIIHYRILN